VARARGFARARGGPRRQVTWIGPADQGYVAVASGAKVLVGSFDAAANGLEKPTVVRTRGEVSIIPSSTASDLSMVGAYGLAIVSDQAFGIGITAIPGPWSDPSWDGWFVWRPFGLRVEVIDSTGVFMSQHSQEVDSKAMRKITDNETLVLVAESQSGAVSISMPLRLLFKLA